MKEVLVGGYKNKKLLIAAMLGTGISLFAYMGSGFVESEYGMSIDAYKGTLLFISIFTLGSLVIAVSSIFKIQGVTKLIPIALSILCLVLLVLEIFGIAFLGAF